jgi:hypothetical protein
MLPREAVRYPKAYPRTLEPRDPMGGPAVERPNGLAPQSLGLEALAALACVKLAT